MSERPAGSLLPREIALVAACLGTSGLAVLAYAFLRVPMSFTVPFVALPASALIVIFALRGQGRFERLHVYSRRLVLGAAMGLLATLAYDAIRPALLAVIGLTFDPYRAILIFGELITGRPVTEPISLAAGWIYHFWNGISFAMLYALVRPRGGIVLAVLWALMLEALMFAAYPRFLAVRLEDPGFLLSSIVGHTTWGVVLGYGLRRVSKE